MTMKINHTRVVSTADATAHHGAEDPRGALVPRSTRCCALVIATLATSACAVGRPSLDTLPAREFTGHFVSGDHASWFTPCGRSAVPDSAWWVTLDGPAGPAVDSARAANGIAPGQSSFVRWEAAYTTSGEIGPRGAGAPALLVRKLIELGPTTPGDCTKP